MRLLLYLHKFKRWFLLSSFNVLAIQRERWFEEASKRVFFGVGEKNERYVWYLRFPFRDHTKIREWNQDFTRIARKQRWSFKRASRPSYRILHSVLESVERKHLSPRKTPSCRKQTARFHWWPWPLCSILQYRPKWLPTAFAASPHWTITIEDIVSVMRVLNRNICR